MRPRFFPPVDGVGVFAAPFDPDPGGRPRGRFPSTGDSALAAPGAFGFGRPGSFIAAVGVDTFGAALGDFAAAAAVALFFDPGGRPRFFCVDVTFAASCPIWTSSSSGPTAAGVFGGRPRGFFPAVVAGVAAAALFALPGGRPRPRFAGVGVVVAGVAVALWGRPRPRFGVPAAAASAATFVALFFAPGGLPGFRFGGNNFDRGTSSSSAVTTTTDGGGLVAGGAFGGRPRFSRGWRSASPRWRCCS